MLSASDFVGQAVFLGSTKAPEGSEARLLYDQGVKFACWGMAMYSLSCSFYSFILDKLIKKFRAKPVYIGGQLVYCLGMICMAVSRLAIWAARDSCIHFSQVQVGRVGLLLVGRHHVLHPLHHAM